MTATPADAPLRPGDLILVDFDPVRGTGQDGRRPALVVSEPSMNTITRRVVVCPITSNVEPWPTKVLLPTGDRTVGAVLTDQIRSIDRRARILRRIGVAPGSVSDEVRYQIAKLLGF